MFAKIKRFFNRVLSIIYSRWKNKKISQSASDSKIVIIFFFGLLGDAVMFLDALTNYRKLCAVQGYELVVACRDEVRTLFQDVGLYEDITFEELNRNRLIAEFKYFKCRSDVLSNYNAEWLVHVRAHNVIEDLFIYSIACGKKISVRGQDIDGNGKKIYQCIVNSTYDIIIDVNELTDQLTNYGMILKKYGMSEYKSKVYELPTYSYSFAFPIKKYILICPGASSAKKAWPKEKFSEIVNHLIEKYTYDIVLSGAIADSEIGNIILKNASDKSRIYNLIGKTNLKEWFSLIQNAKLVIANESGAVHIAAASKTPCVCIGAQEFGDTFLPYRPEYIRKNDCLPYVVRCERLRCSYCKKRKRYIDENGQVCYLKKGVFPCLDKIEVSQVENAVDNLMN